MKEDIAKNVCIACGKCKELKADCYLAKNIACVLYGANYRKIPQNAVVLTKEELAKHDEKVRKETAKEIFSRIETRKKQMHYKTDTYRFASLNGEILRLEKEFGFEVE